MNSYEMITIIYVHHVIFIIKSCNACHVDEDLYCHIILKKLNDAILYIR
jgi:hypothetical protein